MGYEASCSCGALLASTDSDPVMDVICGCQECRLRTGSLFSFHTLFRADEVETSGDASVYSRPGASGQNVNFSFCPNCGTTVYWTIDSKPGVLGIAAGAFRDQPVRRPAAAVWMAHQPEWVSLDPAISLFPYAGSKPGEGKN